jgi:4-amino-4-deoxy-L-arabinose transferase-like glycosyltransferase
MTTATRGVVPQPSGTAVRTGRQGRWQPWVLAVICLGAAALYCWGIWHGQIGNTYYTAAAKSMRDSFTNFLFGSFDPYGVVTVDKPPLFLWPQVISVWLFGYHGWAVLLPQAVEGVAAVFLLHRTVRRWMGEHAALIAALVLALTPITVAIDRDNNPDTLLVLLLVAAAYAFTRSASADLPRGRTLWLLLCAFFVGCGFVTKMMQAWIVVPGFAVAYLVARKDSPLRRIGDLAGAGAVLAVSSFWWPLLHDLWPGTKPYMGGSTNGTAMDLIFGYNGFGRVFGQHGGFGGHGGHPRGLRMGSGTHAAGGMRPPGGMAGMFGGDSGADRLFSDSVGGQISWLLPLSLFVLGVVTVGGILRWRRKEPMDPRCRAVWWMWGSWLLVTGVVFSFAQGIWHPYYTTMLAPAIAAITGAGVVVLWRRYRTPGGMSWALLPIAVLLTGVWSVVLVGRDISWNGWTLWGVVALALAAVVLLLLGRITSGVRRVLGRAGLVVGVVALLFVPAVWSAATAAQTSGIGAMPSAGPNPIYRMLDRLRRSTGPSGMDFPGAAGRRASAMPGPGRLPGMLSGSLTGEQRKILDYAIRNSGGAKITLAVDGGAMLASNYVIGSDATVIGMGGFMGTDDAPSVAQLRQWTSDGTLRFVLGSGRGRSGMPFGGRSSGAAQTRSLWIERNCSVVDPAAYGLPAGHGAPNAGSGTFPGMGVQRLYRCGPAGGA